MLSITVRQLSATSTFNNTTVVGLTGDPQASSSANADANTGSGGGSHVYMSLASILSITMSVIVIFTFCGFLIYRRHKKEKNKGNDTDSFDNFSSRSGLAFAPTHFCAYHSSHFVVGKPADFNLASNNERASESHDVTGGRCQDGGKRKMVRPTTATAGGTFLNVSKSDYYL